MGGSKKFYTCWGGFKKFWRLAKGGQKMFDDKNFQLPSPPPHQSIYEHSLSITADTSTAYYFIIPVGNQSDSSKSSIAYLQYFTQQTYNTSLGRHHTTIWLLTTNKLCTSAVFIESSHIGLQLLVYGAIHSALLTNNRCLSIVSPRTTG